jgi:hypothetical protein
MITLYITALIITMAITPIATPMIIPLALKVGYSPYVNKAFVYISVFKILKFIRQLFIFSCFYSIINYQDTTIRLCKNIK